MAPPQTQLLSSTTSLAFGISRLPRDVSSTRTACLLVTRTQRVAPPSSSSSLSRRRWGALPQRSSRTAAFAAEPTESSSGSPPYGDDEGASGESRDSGDGDDAALLKAKAAVDINNELRVCDYPEDVLDIVEDEAENFNHVNTATAMARLSRMAHSMQQGKRQEVLRDGRFGALIKLVNQQVKDMYPRELCSVLQALVYLKYHDNDTLNAVLKQAQARVGAFKPIDVSLTVWSVASLKMKKPPVRLMNDLVDLSISNVPEMKAQGVSMLLWGLATMNFKPKAALLHRTATQVEKRVEEFAEKPIALVNTLWGLAKLESYAIPALRATVKYYTASEEGRQQLLSYRRPQELVNLFWVFARSGHDPGEEMLRIADEYVDANIERMNGEDLGRLVWIYAVLGHHPSGANILGRIGARAIENIDRMRTDNAGYLIWGMSLLGAGNHPALPQLLGVVEASHANGKLSDKQLRQMFQAHLLSELGGASWSPSETLRTAGALQWIASLNQNPRPNHPALHSVLRELRGMGITHESPHSTEDRVMRADVAIKTKSGSMLAIRVLRKGRDHMQNSMRQTGAYMAWKQLMVGKGYSVIELYEREIFEFSDEGTGAEVLARLLEPYDPEVMEPRLDVVEEEESNAVKEEAEEEREGELRLVGTEDP